MRNISLKKGNVLISILVFSAVALTMTVGLVNWGSSLLRSVKVVAQREQALQIAEAGVDYYRWHLAHAASDYYDGTGTSTPTVHSFTDKDGNVLGSYTLTITQPSTGSTKVTLVSKGTLASSTISRSIKVTLAIPSFAQYAAVANDNMYFGSGTVTYGPIHSNQGIHFDGVAYGTVASAVSTYTDPDYSATRWGVYTMSGTDDPNPPTALPTRADVFTVGRQLSVPVVDFSALTGNLASLKSAAQSGGIYLTASQYGGSAALGYKIVLKTNNTFDLYVVRALQSAPSNCNTDGSTGWGTWSIKTLSSPAVNYAIPANGVVFVEDNVWVEGTINGSRITIAAGKLPDPGAALRPSITVNANLRYTKTDGTDVIGLIAQGNVNVGLYSADTLSIDAALVAQNGRVGRYYYGTNCKVNPNNYYTRSTLNLYGMIGTNVRYGFAYSDSTGYTNRNITYDANLLYGPPPSFPLTSSFYTTLSWQEI